MSLQHYSLNQPYYGATCETSPSSNVPINPDITVSNILPGNVPINPDSTVSNILPGNVPIKPIPQTITSQNNYLGGLINFQNKPLQSIAIVVLGIFGIRKILK